jgi:hypothetical protein
VTWGARSRGEAATVHPDTRRVAERVDEYWSCTVLNGRRDADQQRENVANGYSSTLESRHLLEYSEDADNGVDAIDVAPDPLRWPQLAARMLEIDEMLEALAKDGLTIDDRKDLRAKVKKLMAEHGRDVGRWYAFAGFFHGVAKEMYRHGEIKRRLVHGYDWDGDHDLEDQRLHDLPHHHAASG